MNENSAPGEPESHKDGHDRTGAPYIEVSGSQSTRELRDTSRRRREAEEKLQQHLIEAKEHAHDAEHQAHAKEHSPAKDAAPESAVQESRAPESTPKDS
ncbi:hypothetical protein B1A87_016375 [Arthrobacter sp. KBS0703]|uniref:hypothetical protein n=1 Tax=Bacteria TaxID=2 RepID=UPI0009C9A300|nr:hypothetical protein [Arthrobacter sp. KBS0703]TSE17141.1 hypothetical protein B1A87_016375 [Arthrobacter sp. KBS0703]